MTELSASECAGSDNAAPVRAYRLTLILDADTEDALANELYQLSLRVERGEITRGCSGSPSSGVIYELLLDETQTHERYFEQVREHLKAKGAQ